MVNLGSFEDADRLAEAMRVEILTAGDGVAVAGRSFYVSALGNDENDGLSPARPWRSLERVSRAELLPGDGVLFRRGDLFRGSVAAKPRVTYAAYGEGEKPRLYGWDYDLADPDLWELWDGEHNIWRMKRPILDCGTLVFNHGERHGRKLIPSYKNGRFVVREDEGREFRIAEQMSRDLDLFCRVDSVLTEEPSNGESFPIPQVDDNTLGELYLRCDGGNPGEVFSSVEALPKRNMMNVGSAEGVRIDNLCIKYVGAHGVAAGGYSEGLTVTNCEFGWIGGTVQHYLGTDPNYPRGGRGTVTRYGNAVEVYGGCKDYTVCGCYIYQCYDAGITHQITTNGKRVIMENVLYSCNLVEYCVYSVEYFLSKNCGDRESYMRNIRICDNILRHSGEGWGQQRHNIDTPAHIKGWSCENTASDFLISGNVFDRAAYRMLHLVARDKESLPRVEGNAYIQYLGKPLGQYGANAECEPPIMCFDSDAEKKIRDVLRDATATVITCK